MGAVLIIPLIFIILLLPAALIYRSSKMSGWAKAGWVAACLLSFILPALLVEGGAALAVKFGGYLQTARSQWIDGPEATLRMLANGVGMLLPWTIFFVYHLKYEKKQP